MTTVPEVAAAAMRAASALATLVDQHQTSLRKLRDLLVGTHSPEQLRELMSAILASDEYWLFREPPIASSELPLMPQEVRNRALEDAALAVETLPGSTSQHAHAASAVRALKRSP